MLESAQPEDTKIRSSKYLNNLIEQDHRNIRSRTQVMLGFKQFGSAATTISCIELMHRIRKGQFDLWVLRLKDTAAPAVWNAVVFNKYGIHIYWTRLGLTSYLHQSPGSSHQPANERPSRMHGFRNPKRTRKFLSCFLPLFAGWRKFTPFAQKASLTF